MKSDDFLTFIRRTDSLKSKLRVNLQDLPEKIGVSRATFFHARKPDAEISYKTWAKLDAAEKAAGISSPLLEIPQTAQQHPSDSLDMETLVLEEIRVRVEQYKHTDSVRRALFAKQIHARLEEYAEWCEAHCLRAGTKKAAI